MQWKRGEKGILRSVCHDVARRGNDADEKYTHMIDFGLRVVSREMTMRFLKRAQWRYRQAKVGVLVKVQREMVAEREESGIDLHAIGTGVCGGESYGAYWWRW